MKKEKLDSYVRVRLSDMEKQKLKHLSDSSGMTMSDLIRQKVFSNDAKSIEQFAEEKELSIERITKLAEIEKAMTYTNRSVSGLMNNINQFVRVLNTRRDETVSKDDVKNVFMHVKHISKRYDSLRKKVDDIWQS